MTLAEKPAAPPTELDASLFARNLRRDLGKAAVEWHSHCSRGYHADSTIYMHLHNLCYQVQVDLICHVSGAYVVRRQKLEWFSVRLRHSFGTPCSLVLTIEYNIRHQKRVARAMISVLDWNGTRCRGGVADCGTARGPDSIPADIIARPWRGAVLWWD